MMNFEVFVSFSRLSRRWLCFFFLPNCNYEPRKTTTSWIIIQRLGVSKIKFLEQVGWGFFSKFALFWLLRKNEPGEESYVLWLMRSQALSYALMCNDGNYTWLVGNSSIVTLEKKNADNIDGPGITKAGLT